MLGEGSGQLDTHDFISFELGFHEEFSVFTGQFLERHVPCGPPSAHANLPALQLVSDVVDFGVNPAVGLTVHCFRAESGSYQENISVSFEFPVK